MGPKPQEPNTQPPPGHQNPPVDLNPPLYRFSLTPIFQCSPLLFRQTFPHIYGGISPSAVIRTLEVVRDGEGKFLSIQGI